MGKYGADYSQVFGLQRQNKISRIDADISRMSSRIEGIRAEKALKQKHSAFAKRLNTRLNNEMDSILDKDQKGKNGISFEVWVQRKERQERLKKHLYTQAIIQFENLLRSKEQEQIAAAQTDRWVILLYMNIDRNISIETWLSRKEGKRMKFFKSVLTDQQLQRDFKSFKQWQNFKKRRLDAL